MFCGGGYLPAGLRFEMHTAAMLPLIALLLSAVGPRNLENAMDP